MTKNVLLLFFSLITFSIAAQQEIGLHFAQDVWQSNRTNPAFTTDKKWVISLPSFYFNTQTENFSFSDLIGENDAGERVLNINTVIAQMEERNRLSENLSLQTLGLAYQLGAITLSFDHSIRQNAIFNYPKTLAQLIWQGNAQFVGETVDLTHHLNLSAYHEFALGAAFRATDQLTVGVKAKLLSGIGDISTERGDLSLFTSDEVYQLSLTGDYLLHSASYLQFDGFDNFDLNFEFGEFKAKNLFSKNTGFAIDLGAKVQLEKLQLAASVIDLGAITWKDNVNNYQFNETIEYNGLDIAQAYVEGDIDISAALDTLDQLFNPIETQNSYKTTLPTRFYMSGQYDVSEKLVVGVLFNGVHFKEDFILTTAASVRYRLNKLLTVGGTYALIDQTYDNLGLNANVQLGPMQIYALSDNIISIFKEKYSNANIRVGMNIQFGNKPF